MSDPSYITRRNMTYIFAAWSVEKWVGEHGGQVPTVEQLQEEPLLFTPEFAQEWMDYAAAHGWIVDEPAAPPVGGRDSA